MDNDSNQDHTALASPPDDQTAEIGMINNESVQKIGENGHVEGDEDEAEEEQDFGNSGPSSQGNFQNNNFQNNQIGHQDAYGQPMDILPQDQEDLDAIIESISYGKTQQVKKLQFQAFTAAIAHEDQVKFVVDYLNNVNNTTHSKFPTARNRLLAYRVSQLDQISQREVMAEGFDDDGEDGAGEKLLHLLQKMEIENIVLIVCIWNNGVQIGSQQLKGGEFFRIVVERARELLNQIQEQIYQEEIAKFQMNQSSNDISGAVVGQGQFQGGDVNMSQRKVDRQGSQANPFKLNLIQKKKAQAQADANGLGVDGKNVRVKDAKADPQIDNIDRKIFQHFKQDLTEKDYDAAQIEIEESLKELSKANVMELRQIAKPHPLVEKTMQIVCALRGFKNLNWSTARDFLAKNSLKVELKQITSDSVKSEDILKAQQILVQKTNTLLTPENVQIHSQGAAFLLVWAANVIKHYAALKWLGDDVKKRQPAFSNLESQYKRRDLQQITIETKIQMRQQKRAENDRWQEEAKDRKRKDGDEDDDSEQEEGEEGEDEDEEERARRKAQRKAKRQEENKKERQRSLQKVGIIGHYLNNKAMMFGGGLDAGPDADRPKKLVDLTIVKKGPNFASKAPKDEQMQEEAFLRAEEDRLNKQAKEAERVRKLDEAKRKDEKEQQIEKQKEIMKGTEKKKEPEPEGKLRPTQIPTLLSDDVDEVIKQLNEIDFGVQDLDVLIDLSKHLKTKRLQLFPDTSYVFSLQNAGLSNDQIDEAAKPEDQAV